MSHPQTSSFTSRHDAVVVGLGVTGIYQAKKLLDLGLDVKIIEAGSGVGGTWYWNRYPAARFDSESYVYGYFSDKELLEEWNWSEEYAGQPEIERYFNHVVDRWNLRKHAQFNTRVEGATYDEVAGEWEIHLSTGVSVRSKYFVPCTGLLSIPYKPAYENLDSFTGEMYHTAEWPKAPVDFAGKKVAVFGTGSSGVQIIPVVAEVAQSLTVFQRTPNWCTPLNNKPISEASMAEIRANYDFIYDRTTKDFMGMGHEGETRTFADATAEERLQKYEELYRKGGLQKVSDNFADNAIDMATNQAWCDFLAAKIRQRVKDPVLAEKLIPKDHGFGAKRPPMETNYFEAYNRDNVELVELLETPVTTFTATGVETTEKSFDFDIIVLATGFDAVTGAMMQMDIRGVDGAELRDAWEDGPVTLYGAGVPGFPNLFILGGPHVGAGNVPRATEHQVDFVTAIIERAEKVGSTKVEVKDEAAAAFVEHVQESVAALSPIFNYTKNWYTGGNIPGKKVIFTQYAPGVPEYRRRMLEEADAGFPSVAFA